MSEYDNQQSTESKQLTEMIQLLERSNHNTEKLLERLEKPSRVDLSHANISTEDLAIFIIKWTVASIPAACIIGLLAFGAAWMMGAKF